MIPQSVLYRADRVIKENRLGKFVSLTKEIRP